MAKRPLQSRLRPGKKANLVSSKDIERLLSEVLKEAKYNNLVELLLHYSPIVAVLKTDEDEKAEKLGRLLSLSLYKCFAELIGLRAMDENGKSDKKRVVAKWLKDKYAQYKAQLCALLQTELAFESSLQLDALDIMLKLVKAEGKVTDQFPDGTYQELVFALLSSSLGTMTTELTSTNFVLLEFLEKFEKYADLQMHFFSSDTVARIDEPFVNYHTIIEHGLSYDEGDIWAVEPDLDEPFKENFQRCFLEVLRKTKLTSAHYEALLLPLHKRVLPYMTTPACLMDFLTDAYNLEDDNVPILALNSLWELIREYNLDYPDFYTKLYSLLTPALFYTRYRLRFMRLCSLFLSLTHVSASLVASFIKRMARLSLSASASGVVIVIPFVYNLLKQHPTCMSMLHNTLESTSFVDPFDPEEPDPQKTKAILLSLWELETLMSHYHPNIATLAKIFGEPFRKERYNMEDFLDWSYASLLESEKKRKYKGPASLEHEEWDLLFDNGGNSYIRGWTL